MKTRTLALAVLILLTPLPSLADNSLPERLELVYDLKYGSLTVGRSTRTLTRQSDGSYRHTLHTRPLGMARVLTRTEWFEEGSFRIHLGEVQPLDYLIYRTGASKPHRHSVTFDYDKNQIRYASGITLPLPAHVQDQGSILYALMLRPPGNTRLQDLPLSSAKKLRKYQHRYLRTEEIETRLGRFTALVIEWAPQVRTAEDEVFTAWLAVDKGHVPVKIVTQENDRTATMVLESLSGI